jgi:drug/metabolite transporter (DMT)-like permease
VTLVEQNQYRLGVAYVALSALAWSSSGLFMRAIHADLMTILFYRGIVSGSGVFALFLFIERGRAWRIIGAMRGPSFAATFFSAAAMISGIGSIYYATVADAMVIYATVPFVTAGVAFLVIRERPSVTTMIAAAVALAGVLVMLTGDSGGGGSWFGRGLAVIMTLAVAGLAVVMRRHRDVPMLPAMAASGWVCALVCFWFASPAAVSGADVGLVIGFGLIQNALGLCLYTFGSRLIPAADASLLTALEVPLTPLWVWIFFSETPSPATMIGGPIVLLALFGHIFTEVRRHRAPLVANLG